MSEIFELMGACNGEIRMLKCRYEPGFICLIVLEEKDPEFLDQFYDFICGDNDYFDARAFFESATHQQEECFGCGKGDSPAAALIAATESLEAAYARHLAATEVKP
jgi:hypothetical protein